MEHTRYQRGIRNLAAVDGEGGQAVLQALEDIAPGLGRYIVEFAFGDIYARPGLSLQERELVTVAVLLAAGGCEPQLEVHINGALNTGVSREKLVESMIHCVPYVGFPRVLNGIFTAKKVFAAR